MLVTLGAYRVNERAICHYDSLNALLKITGTQCVLVWLLNLRRFL